MDCEPGTTDVDARRKMFAKFATRVEKAATANRRSETAKGITDHSVRQLGVAEDPESPVLARAR